MFEEKLVVDVESIPLDKQIKAGQLFNITTNNVTYLTHTLHKYPAKFIPHVPEVKQIIFEWDKIKSDGGGCETNEKFDIGDLMRIESDIGFPFLIKGWRYWFKHMACSGYSKFEVIVECGYYSYEGGFIFVRECNKL